MIMASFIAQPGEPLVTFGEPTNGHVSVEQHRFYSDSSVTPDTKQKWTIPVCFITNEGKSCTVVTPETTIINLPKSTLFFANAGGAGFYRSTYPADVYNHILASAEARLSPEERIAFSGDAWAQVRANKATVGDYLNLVAALKDDPEQTVLGSILDGAQSIYGRVAATKEEKDALKVWIVKTFAPSMQNCPRLQRATPRTPSRCAPCSSGYLVSMAKTRR